MNQNKCKRRKGERAVKLIRKAKDGFYNSLDDFLRENPIAVSNQYGEKIISGIRVC